MKQCRIIQAVKVLDKLKDQAMPLPVSYKLYRLRKALQEHWDWQVEQEMGLLEKHGTNTGNGINLTAESREAFNSDLANIVETEVEVDWQEVEIEMSDGLTLSVEDIESLEGFVRIGDGKE